MKAETINFAAPRHEPQADTPRANTVAVSATPNIGVSIDNLVDYLVDNQVGNIYPLVMHEVEKRLIFRVLQKTEGNKQQAARILGMSRNTFSRKMQRLLDVGKPEAAAREGRHEELSGPGNGLGRLPEEHA